MLPLAYLLDDETLKEKVKPWIEWTLASQKPNGYFGPDTDRTPEPGLQRTNAHDWWPKMVMLKIMQQYYSATGDERVISFLTNYFKYQLAELPKKPLGNWTFWGEQRGGDNLMVVYWLYNITGEKFLLELGELLHKQTFNWTDVFLNQDHLSRQLSMHCVNLGQGFKEPVVYYQQSKEQKQIDAVKKAVKDMRNTIGLPTGLWGGDELLRFGEPTTGSELCTAIEMMFSLEEILEITGDGFWGDYLERVTFNALPTQVTDAYDARQYYQQLNQIELTHTDRNFVTCYEGTDQLMGLLAGYPCCTSNLHQGWPKYVQNLWYATREGGLAALAFGPSEVEAQVAGKTVRIKEETNYPMEETIKFTVDFDGAGSIPILAVTTMPGDDVTHPVPDNTGYITEGQYYLKGGRIEPFGSLSRLKQNVNGKTRNDHRALMDGMIKLYAQYKESLEKKSMGFMMTEWDDKLLKYGEMFETKMMDLSVNIPLEDALDLGWDILAECFDPVETGMKTSLIEERWPNKDALN